MTDRVEFLIEKLQLISHPEGGFFRETYRASQSYDSIPQFSGSRNFSTGIYFLIAGDSRSHLHRIKSDEMWHFYEGSPLKIHLSVYWILYHLSR